MLKYKNIILYLLCIVIGFVYAISRLKPEALELYHTEKDIRAKTAELSDLEKKLENLKATALQAQTTSTQTKNIYKPSESSLDAESSFTIPFNDVVEMAKYNGIKIYSIEYVYNPADDEFVKGAGSTYNVCQLKMEVISDYTDLESFIRELYKYPYLVNIEKVELTPYLKNKKMIVSNLQVKLYSSKDGAESMASAATDTASTKAEAGSTATAKP